MGASGSDPPSLWNSFVSTRDLFIGVVLSRREIVAEVGIESQADSRLVLSVGRAAGPLSEEIQRDDELSRHLSKRRR